jgi:divalent metal cation (Fe/Co/Zn/Cd) transporter
MSLSRLTLEYEREYHTLFHLAMSESAQLTDAHTLTAAVARRVRARRSAFLRWP